MKSLPAMGDEKCTRCGFKVRICQTMTACDGPAPPLSPREREIVDRFEAAPDPFAGEKCDCIAVDQGLIIDCTLTLGHAGSCYPGSIDWSRAPGGAA